MLSFPIFREDQPIVSLPLMGGELPRSQKKIDFLFQGSHAENTVMLLGKPANGREEKQPLKPVNPFPIPVQEKMTCSFQIAHLLTLDQSRLTKNTKGLHNLKRVYFADQLCHKSCIEADFVCRMYQVSVFMITLRRRSSCQKSSASALPDI